MDCGIIGYSVCNSDVLKERKKSQINSQTNKDNFLL